MVLGEARGKQTSNLILKVSLLAKKSDVWNIWEPWAVEKFHEKYLNFCETLNAIGYVLEVKIRFLQLLRWQSDVAPPNGSNLKVNFFS